MAGGELEPDHKEDGQFPKQLIEDRPGAVEGRDGSLWRSG